MTQSNAEARRTPPRRHHPHRPRDPGQPHRDIALQASTVFIVDVDSHHVELDSCRHHRRIGNPVLRTRPKDDQELARAGPDGATLRPNDAQDVAGRSHQAALAESGDRDRRSTANITLVRRPMVDEHRHPVVFRSRC